ncbi:HET domain-containing protein [Candidatus Bathyarchaeota archaeon]|nr:HET domain-containing protein [Candidatus Bathyarchaeota archaeon]
MDDDMTFTALSYVWGDESITEEVLLEGHRRAVTTNLESALRNFWRYAKENGDSAMARSLVWNKQLEEGGGMAPLRRFLASESCSLHHESDVEAESSSTEGSTDDETSNDEGEEADEGDSDDEGEEEDKDVQSGNETLLQDDAEGVASDVSEDNESSGSDIGAKYHARNDDDIKGRDDAGEESEMDGEDSTDSSETDYDASNTEEFAWGNTHASDRIKSSYLRALVGEGSATIWVDALCINQNDLTEKSHQISLMREIYATADCVFSYLGEPDEENIDWALNTIRSIVPRLKFRDESNMPGWLRHYPELCDGATIDPESNEGWGAILNFEGAEYFRRLWIFQELWAAGFTVFICGNEYLPMRTCQVFQDWTASVRRMPEEDAPGSMGSTEPVAWGEVRMSFAWPRPDAVFMVRIAQAHPMASSSRCAHMFLQIVRKFDCTDPRDKVFVLLGILQMDILVDYTMSVAEVYKRWATSPYWDISRGSLLVFSGVGLYPREEGYNLPSWLPDLYNLGSQFPEWDGPISSGYTASEAPDPFQPSVGLDGFRCFGVQVAEVSEIVIPGSKTPDDLAPAEGEVPLPRL